MYQCRINFVQTLVFYNVNYQSRLDTGWTLYIYCRKLLFPQSEEGWACCTSNTVQTLVFYSRLPWLNRHWIDLVHSLSVNYFFHSQDKVGPIVSQHCTNVGNQQSIFYVGLTFNRSSQSAECHDFCLGIYIYIYIYTENEGGRS